MTKAGDDSTDVLGSTGQAGGAPKTRRAAQAYRRNTTQRPAAEPAAASEPSKEEAKTLEVLVREHADQVRRLARRYARNSGGAVDADDLISVGVMGLIDAHQRYDPSGGRPFRVYAEYRIRGAILDELRRLDPMSQPKRREARRLERQTAELATQLGREPSDEELADHLETDVETVQRARRDAQEYRFVPVDQADRTDLRVDIAGSKMDKASLRIVLRQALEQLPDREKTILTLYYFHDLNMREIGKVLELTEARISQLHKKAVKSLRVVLDEEGGPASG